jgi:hypothetical protein
VANKDFLGQLRISQNSQDAPIEQVESEAVFQKPSSHWMARQNPDVWQIGWV